MVGRQLMDAAQRKAAEQKQVQAVTSMGAMIEPPFVHVGFRWVFETRFFRTSFGGVPFLLC